MLTTSPLFYVFLRFSNCFRVLRGHVQDFTLYVANPGYYKDAEELPDGVIKLGQDLSHWDLLGHIGTSLCTFYPQTVFEETLGLVYVESNAMGTPVLAHDLGAAFEVLNDPRQIVNCGIVDNVVSTVLRWSAGERPTVGLNKTFKLTEVMKTWIKLIDYGSIK
jgi:hypothetical protein